MVAMLPGLTAVLAVKQLDRAKSRLPHPDAAHRRALVLAMFEDTLDAVAAAGVGRIVVVSPDALVRQPAREHGALARHEGRGPGGLNAALHHGAADAPGAVLYLQADLPAVRPESLRAAIDAAQGRSASFVADRHRTGTALLYVARGDGFAPAFGTASAAAHRAAGAAELDPAHTRWPDLRCDVDTEADLAAALRLGAGPRTVAVLRHARRVPSDDDTRDRVQ